MAPRTSWKGYLKLSLVLVPVKAVTANETSEEIRLNQLHKECNGRVRYKKVCAEHGELKADQIVSGYEFGKDQYVVIDPKELNKLRTESDRSVRIDGFIDPEEIDPIYYAGKTYYLLPDGGPGEKPYTLLHRGMVEGNVYGIAQIVLSGREQLVLLRPVDNLLAMSVLTYPKKIKAIAPLSEEVGEQEMKPEELQLTQTLIDASRLEDFELDAYTDTYVEKLKQLIQMRIDGQEVVQAPDQEEPVIVNLMEALKKSVAEAQLAGNGTRTKTAREKRPAKRVSKKKSSKKMASGAKQAPVRKKKTGS